MMHAVWCCRSVFAIVLDLLVEGVVAAMTFIPRFSDLRSLTNRASAVL